MKRMKYFGAAALLALLAACSNDDLENISYPNDPLAVRVNATAGKNVITRSFPTDDTQQTAFKDGDRISVGTEGQDAVIYTKEGADWGPESGYLKWTSSSLTFNAYYPVDKNNASMTTFDVPKEQNSLEAIGNADYMTYSGAQTKPASADGSITLNLTRKMARVVIGDIKFLDQYKTGYSVTAISVHGNTSGYENGTPKTGGIAVNAYKDDNGKFYALLSPTTLNESETFLSVTVKADDSDDTKELLVKGIPALSASNSYTYALTVGKNMITISSVTVENWYDGGPVIADNGEGEAEEQKDPKVDKNNNSITTYKEGQIAENPQLIVDAIGTDGSLAISGPMNDADIAALKKYMTNNTDATLSLDLKGAKLASIPARAFVQITGLVSIKLPEGLKVIGDSWNGSTFSECTALQSVEFPSTLEVMEFSSFWGCTSLTTIDLSKTKVASIEAALFRNCSSLTSVSFGPETSVFNNTVFVGCSSLTTIDLSLCEAVPTFNYTPGDDSESPFYNLEKSKITIYVKDADMKTAFEGSDWVTRVGFTADNFVVKNNQ
ncbi:leucine-rich repeat protein [Phocaeicola barnesiae]|uniref:leucine-rich repeat protein n=1 Tax=Phocaeicola barnesiae TaxID=376804 RepID=UPI0003A9C73E|nr:leucine-rich repeat protein [Phocaeicola barnesiae]